MVNDQLTSTTLNNIAAGINADVDTNYVNITGTRIWCYQNQGLNKAGCVSYVQQQEQKIMVRVPLTHLI